MDKEVSEFFNSVNVFEYLAKEFNSFGEGIEQMAENMVISFKLFSDRKSNGDYVLNIFFKTVGLEVLSMTDFIYFLAKKLDIEVNSYDNGYFIIANKKFEWVSIIQIDSEDQRILDIFLCKDFLEADKYLEADWAINAN